MVDYRKNAYAIRDKMGLNCVPLSATKLPKIKWKHLQTNYISDEEIEEHCSNCLGLAILTGLNISPVYCLDFDIGKLNPNGKITAEGFFSAFMERIPFYIKTKFLINATSSGVGRHVWLKTDSLYRTSKIVHRMMTIPEVIAKYSKMQETSTLDIEELSNLVLRKPYECIVESRGTGSYAVFKGARYSRVSGEKINKFSDTEVNLILDTLYSMDCFFKFPTTYIGKKEHYRILCEFNDVVLQEDVMECVLSTGAFTDAGIDGNGNRKFKSITTSAAHSGYVFEESRNLYSFSHNTIFGQGSLRPHEVFQKCNSLEDDELVNFMKNYIDSYLDNSKKSIIFEVNSRKKYWKFGKT